MKYEDPDVQFTLAQHAYATQPSQRTHVAPLLAASIRELFPTYAVPAQLIEDGVVVVPVFNATERKQWRETMLRCIHSFPEYTDTSAPVLGGFAALGNPSSFHHPDIRRLRHRVYNHVKNTVLRPYAAVTGMDMQSELLFDRLMWRQPGQAATAESWHRDVCVPPPRSTLQEEDAIFGGWTNFDDVDQVFSCVPGTHLDRRLFEFKPGFDKIQKEQHARYKQRSHRIRVPPGHAVVFFQHIVHEVVSSPAKHDMIRLFHGYRLTHATVSLFDCDYRERDVFASQGLPRLPSFQLPAMFSSNHQSLFLGIPKDPNQTELNRNMRLPGSTHKTNLIEWSTRFQEQFLVEKIHERTNKPYVCVRRFLCSLREAGLPLYPPYSAEERALYTPQPLHSNNNTPTN